MTQNNLLSIIFIFFTCSIALSSCNNEDDNLPTCDQVWTVVNYVSAAGSVAISNGDMVLSSENTPTGLALMVYRDGFTGDFDAAFTFESFEAGDSLGGYVQMAIADTTLSLRCTSGIGNVPSTGISAFIDSTGTGSGNPVIQNTNSLSGSFRIKREGNFVTVTTIAGTDTATISDGFYSGPIRIGLQLGSNYAPLAGTTSIHITSFSVTGGGSSASSDSFDCNSLK